MNASHSLLTFYFKQVSNKVVGNDFVGWVLRFLKPSTAKEFPEVFQINHAVNYADRVIYCHLFYIYIYIKQESRSADSGNTRSNAVLSK